MDNDISDEIALRHNLNIRTYFRKLEAAESNFYSFMVKMGFDEEKLFSYLAEEKWILEVYENFLKQGKETQNGVSSKVEDSDDFESEL